jgi:hypothetical protein
LLPTWCYFLWNLQIPVSRCPRSRGSFTRYLTRLTDKEKKKTNNRKACPSSLERPPGKQCDEYPFQSTWQGAATGSGDFSRRMIDKDQNRLGGGALKNFYLFNRIVEKDRFLVWIK